LGLSDVPTIYPDFFVWAGEQRVGRIYEGYSIPTRETWHRAINTVTLDMTVGTATQGYAESFDDAKAKFRAGFDRWLEWAWAMPRGDMKYPRISAELKNMGRLKDAEPRPAQ
jgi:hypothetical protein